MLKRRCTRCDEAESFLTVLFELMAVSRTEEDLANLREFASLMMWGREIRGPA